MKKKTILGIVGATASGKTALSLSLAQQLHADILCMDSMQVYKHMDIGTAKPTALEQSLVPHYLLDLTEPSQPFTVTDYADAARPLMDTLSTPMLVGGTGLYLQALSSGENFGAVKGDETIRQKLHAIADAHGPAYLYSELQKADPDYAAKIHANDVRRVVRALEVYELTGLPFSKQPTTEVDTPYSFCLFALDLPRDVLYDRVNKRVDVMMKEGLLAEVEALWAMGVPSDASSIQGLGYKELYAYLAGECSLEDAISLIKLRTRHFAKRQLTWFRRDTRIHWLDGTLPQDILLQQALDTIHTHEVTT